MSGSDRRGLGQDLVDELDYKKDGRNLNAHVTAKIEGVDIFPDGFWFLEIASDFNSIYILYRRSSIRQSHFLRPIILCFKGRFASF